jgi:hypothetical protein
MSDDFKKPRGELDLSLLAGAFAILLVLTLGGIYALKSQDRHESPVASADTLRSVSQTVGAARY